MDLKVCEGDVIEGHRGLRAMGVSSIPRRPLIGMR